MEIKDTDNLNNVMDKIKLFYDNYIKLLSIENIIIININDNNENNNKNNNENNNNENKKYLLKFIDKNMLNKLIHQYNYFTPFHI